ncbi:uncharacterized protein VTP21DRAFT_4324 [Calcarisporiella thermophila]|uniref:uncharacterized protein n=1 Tax=Calcarisporiella thermophila TaxID=911321 RepID=UPI003742EC27
MTQYSLPIIDISPFVSSSSDPAEKRSCAEAIHTACRDVGFFYLVGHGVPTELNEEVLKVAREFFERPEEEKLAIGIEKNDNARGYQKLGQNITKGRKDYHEGIDLYRPVEPDHVLVKKGLPIRGANLWPTQPASFRPTFEVYIERMLALGAVVMRAIALGLGLEETFFDSCVDKSFWVMRAIGYPPLQDANDRDVGVSCGEHTDYGCLTLLLQDSTPGALQVRTKQGDWIQANPVPGAYVVNIGDMLNVWTNDLYQSTLHRVIHRGQCYRVSVPFFFEPNFHARVEPIAKCIGDKERKYDAVVYGEHLLRKVMNNFTLEL